MKDPQRSQKSADLDAKCEEWKATAEKSIRDEPLKTVGLALGAGFLLSVLPVGRVIGGMLQLSVSLLRPALLIFGMVKLVEEFDKRRKP